MHTFKFWKHASNKGITKVTWPLGTDKNEWLLLPVWFVLAESPLFYLRLFLRLQTHIAGIKITLTPLALNSAPAFEVWKVYKLPALSSWTYSALVTVEYNGIYTFLHHGTEKRFTVASLHQCSELRVRNQTYSEPAAVLQSKDSLLLRSKI